MTTIKKYLDYSELAQASYGDFTVGMFEKKIYYVENKGQRGSRARGLLFTQI